MMALSLIGRVILLACCVAPANLLGPVRAAAQESEDRHELTPREQDQFRAKLNESTLILLSSRPGSSYHVMGQEIAAMLPQASDLRVLAMGGGDGVESVRDLLFLRGVDLAIVGANVLQNLKSDGYLGVDLQQRLTYVAPLYSEELHVLAGRGITSVEDLRGKTVAVPLDDGNSEFALRDVFRRLGIAVEPISLGAINAVERVRSGELGAVVFLGGKPLRLVAGLPRDGNLKLLSVPISDALEEGYTPAILRAEDYPGLIPPGGAVDTIAVTAVLLARNPRRGEGPNRRLAKFVPAFFASFSDPTSSRRHPKWNDMNLASSLPGWVRFAAAEEWLNTVKGEQTSSLRKSFEEFLRSTQGVGSAELPPATQKKLFDEFVRWVGRPSTASSGASGR